jgi:hypothetical protein
MYKSTTGHTEVQRCGSGSGIRINIPDHMSEGLETIFWVKILTVPYIFSCGSVSGIRNLFDPGPGMEEIRIRDKHPTTGHTEF